MMADDEALVSFWSSTKEVKGNESNDDGSIHYFMIKSSIGDYLGLLSRKLLILLKAPRYGNYP